MKLMLDLTCERCGARESTNGLSQEEALEVGASHVCPDGVRVPIRTLAERLVLGPGERLRDREEDL